MKKTLLLCGLAFALAGCQSVPPLNFSVPNVRFSQKKIDAELKSMTVSIARTDEKTGELPAGMERMVPQLWQTSLQESLNRMAIFNDDAPRKVNLAVKILKFDVPEDGLAAMLFKTETAARYEIFDRKTGEIIYSRDFISRGELPFDMTLVGDARQREAINRAVQNNIAGFLQSLETLEIAKPVVATASNGTAGT
ncbi:UDP-N-acetylglucosamine acyltransferase [Massilia horti]|uniref:UDP-N-acetylglucosamine acyltransferase n=1 Tax=Massilia horti TaxID=2562153 RepID=A0A4Y9T4Y2_9BURK|nr:UDP-N-acetylglucosamine acyltransferase [Massilia horti]TFW33441.1 UDP-N-acetylglucosamine acyltransferase [Massilia horti]